MPQVKRKPGSSELRDALTEIAERRHALALRWQSLGAGPNYPDPTETARDVRALRAGQAIDITGADLIAALWQVDRGDLARAIDETQTYTVDPDGGYEPAAIRPPRATRREQR